MEKKEIQIIWDDNGIKVARNFEVEEHSVESTVDMIAIIEALLSVLGYDHREQDLALIVYALQKGDLPLDALEYNPRVVRNLTALMIGECKNDKN